MLCSNILAPSPGYRSLRTVHNNQSCRSAACGNNSGPLALLSPSTFASTAGNTFVLTDVTTGTKARSLRSQSNCCVCILCIGTQHWYPASQFGRFMNAGSDPCAGCGDSGIRGLQQTGVASICYAGASSMLVIYRCWEVQLSQGIVKFVSSQETQPTLVLHNPADAQSQSIAMKGEQPTTAVVISHDGKHVLVARGHPAPFLQVYCTKTVRPPQHQPDDSTTPGMKHLLNLVDSMVLCHRTCACR